jgi:hypothetical protein
MKSRINEPGCSTSEKVVESSSWGVASRLGSPHNKPLPLVAPAAVSTLVGEEVEVTEKWAGSFLAIRGGDHGVVFMVHRQ